MPLHNAYNPRSSTRVAPDEFSTSRRVSRESRGEGRARTGVRHGYSGGEPLSCGLLRLGALLDLEVS